MNTANGHRGNTTPGAKPNRSTYDGDSSSPSSLRVTAAEPMEATWVVAAATGAAKGSSATAGEALDELDFETSTKLDKGTGIIDRHTGSLVAPDKASNLRLNNTYIQGELGENACSYAGNHKH